MMKGEALVTLLLVAAFASSRKAQAVPDRRDNRVLFPGGGGRSVSLTDKRPQKEVAKVVVVVKEGGDEEDCEGILELTSAAEEAGFEVSLGGAKGTRRRYPKIFKSQGVPTFYSASGSCCWEIFPARFFRGVPGYVGRGGRGVAATGLASARRVLCREDL